MYWTWRGTWSFRRTLCCREWQREQFCGTFELGDLVEAGAVESGPGGRDEGATGEVTAAVGESAAKIVRVSPMVAAVDPGVGRGLVVPAGGGAKPRRGGRPGAAPTRGGGG